MEPDQREQKVSTRSDECRSTEEQSCTERRNNRMASDLCNLDASKPRCIDGYCLMVDLRGSEERLAASCGPQLLVPK